MIFGACASTNASISVMHHLQCHCCHMVPMPMALCSQKSNVATQFHCLHVRNAMVSLITPLVLCDISASTNSVI